MRSTWIVLGLLLSPALVGAQQFQPLDFDTPEAWAMKYFTSATLLTSFGPPQTIAPGSLRVGLEAGHLPSLSAQQRTVGFGGTKEENLNKLPFLIRPRLVLGLPAQLTLTLSAIPPVRVWGLEPSVFSASLGNPVIRVGRFTTGVTLYGQVGRVEGDFTCSAEQAAAGPDSEDNPFGCEAPSRDALEMYYVGLEVSAGYRIPIFHGVTPYLSLAANHLNSRFQVVARYGGTNDRTAIETHGFSGSGAAGVTVGLTRFLSLGGQAFVSPMAVRRPGELRSIDGLMNARLYIEWKALD